MNEICRGDQTVHAGTVVERIRAPQRWNDVAEIGRRQAAANARPIGVVAPLALRDIDRAAARRIGGAIELGNFSGAESGNPLSRRHAGRQELDVSNQGLHFRRIGGHGAAVHAARHAGVHALLDRDLGARPRAVFGEFVIEAEDRQPEFFGPGLEVAIAASEIVAGIPLRRIADFRPDMGVGRRDEIAATPHQAAIIVVRQRANLGYGPDHAARRRRGLGMTVRRQQRQYRD